jgi:hypothetical protein
MAMARCLSGRVPGKAETGFARNVYSDVIARWKRSRSDVFQLKRVPALLRGEMFPPQRIVSLTEETVETLYLLGEQDRIVGISGYCVRPPEARRDKPRVSAFTSADIPKILGSASSPRPQLLRPAGRDRRPVVTTTPVGTPAPRPIGPIRSAYYSEERA